MPHQFTEPSNHCLMRWTRSFVAFGVVILISSLAVCAAIGGDFDRSQVPTIAPRNAIDAFNQGDSLSNEGHYVEAEAAYRQSLTLAQQSTPDDPLVGVALSHLGNNLLGMGRYDEALSIFSDALSELCRTLGPDSLQVAEVLSSIGFAQGETGQYKIAIESLDQSIAIIEQNAGPESQNLIDPLTARAILSTKPFLDIDTEPLFRKAVMLAEKAAQSGDKLKVRNLALVLESYGGYLSIVGRDREAFPLVERALSIQERVLPEGHPHIIDTLQTIGNILSNEGHSNEAEPYLRKALIFSESDLRSNGRRRLYAAMNLATCLSRLDRDAEAELLLRQSIENDEDRDQSFFMRRISLADTLRRERKYILAENELNGVLAAALENHDDTSAQIAHLTLGLSYHEANQPGEAVAQWRAAMKQRLARAVVPKYSESIREWSDADYTQHRFAFYFAADDLVAAGAGSRAGVTAETLEASQLSQTRAAAEAVARMAARFAAGSDPLAAAIRDKQDAEARRDYLRQELARVFGTPENRRSAGNDAKLSQELTAVEQRITATDSLLQRDFPRYVEIVDSKPMQLPEIQELLGEDEAMLSWLVGPEATFLWVVRNHAADILRLNIGAATLEEEVTALRERLDPERNAFGETFPATRAYDLYEKVFAPALPLLSGVREVLVVPDGALESLPFEVLVTHRPKHDPSNNHPEDNRQIAWLARERAVTVLPSVSALRALRQVAANGHATSPFLGVGDPVLTGPPGIGQTVIAAGTLLRGAMADVKQVRELRPLHQTNAELHTVARLLGAGEDELYLQERASEPVLRRVPLDRYRVVEFATHGLVAGELGIPEPALVLTPPKQASPENDGLLTASKIATLRFNADWVVLSACNTAASDGRPDAEGLSGLAKAFFYAGSRALLVSHWVVDSDAAARLTTGTFSALAKDPSISRSEALRRSEMAMLDDPSQNSRFAAPQFWAPFVLVGDNRGYAGK